MKTNKQYGIFKVGSLERATSSPNASSTNAFTSPHLPTLFWLFGCFSLQLPHLFFQGKSLKHEDIFINLQSKNEKQCRVSKESVRSSQKKECSSLSWI